MKIKPKFKGRRPSISFTSKAKDGAEKTSDKTDGKKARSKAARAMTEDSDEDAFSDGGYSDASDREGENDGEDNFFRNKPNSRFQLERTWSVNAFNISSHSAGVVYLDDSEGNSETDDDSGIVYLDDSETDDDSSSNDDLSFDCNDDEEEDNTTAKMTNETKSDKTRRIPTRKKKRGSETKKLESPLSTRRTCSKFKKEMKELNNAPNIIPEGNEEDEIEDLSKGSSNDFDNESDDDSVSRYRTPFSLKRPPSISELMSNKNIDSGYSSDSALVRKRIQMLQQQQDEARRKEGTEQSSNEGKKKKGGKKKVSSKKKVKKKGNKNRNNLEKENSAQSGGGSLEGDSTVTTISVESEEEVRQSHETKDDKNGKKTKKKKKKNKNAKDDKKKKKRAVISFLVDGDDEACADFDKRLEEIEQFEASLVEERKLIQKERETMAFERESMEMRLDEETHHCDELNLRIKELEQLVQSQQISNAGNVVESIDEKHGLKLDFARDKREFHLQLVEKEREIEDLKITIRDLKMMHGAAKNGEDPNNMADGKSRERLQGELLQTVAKLSEKEAHLTSQGKELDLAREEVAALKLGRETLELKKFLLDSQEDSKKLQQELENDRKENAAKLKDKDETVTFLMNELARLKQEQSISSKGR